MSVDVVIGLDCGTSYTKLSAFSLDGRELYQRLEQSPAFDPTSPCDTEYAAKLWKTVRQLLNDTVASILANSQFPLAAAIVGISPVLIAFDPESPDLAIAIPYWYLPSVDGEAKGIDRTMQRINWLRLKADAMGLSRPIVCDLMGYITYRLTGKIVMNSITAGELGFTDEENLHDLIAHNNGGYEQVSLLSPGVACGIATFEMNGQTLVTSVCAGASDSFGAALSSGSTRGGARMIYLGTFGSLLEVVDDLLPVVCGRSKPCLPYRWRLSAPGFGAAIENYAQTHFVTGSLRTSLRQLDHIASKVLPGADGVFFHLPVWDDLGVVHGSYGFSGWGKQEPPYSLGSRAVLESIAYAIRARATEAINTTEPMGVAGGGAASETWRQIISDTLGVPIRSSCYSSGAFAAAYIAGRSFGWSGKAANTVNTTPNLHAYRCTHETATRSQEWYDHL